MRHLRGEAIQICRRQIRSQLAKRLCSFANVTLVKNRPGPDESRRVTQKRQEKSARTV